MTDYIYYRITNPTQNTWDKQYSKEIGISNHIAIGPMDNSSYILYILSLLIKLIKYAERQWTLLLFLLITKRERGNTQLDLLTKKEGNTHTYTHTQRESSSPHYPNGLACV